MEMGYDWSEINGDILGCIMDKLDLTHYFRAGAVCRSWQVGFAERFNQKKNMHALPLLLIPPKLNDKDQMRSLYCLSTKRLADLQAKVPHNKYCVGSCFGWLITMEKLGFCKYSLQLCNPFLPINNIINLPSLDNTVERTRMIRKYDLFYIKKIVLSANPVFASDNYALVAIVGENRMLAYFRPGIKNWIPIEWEKREQWAPNHDVIFFNKAQQFYSVLDRTGEVLAVDLEQEVPKMKVVAPPTQDKSVFQRYLVETSSGDLLQVLRHEVGVYDVLRLDTVMRDWIQIHNIGENGLFLGTNSSLFLSLSNISGCETNCIYYTDEWLYSVRSCTYEEKDNEIYSLENGTSQPHYPFGLSQPYSSPPVWLELT